MYAREPEHREMEYDYYERRPSDLHLLGKLDDWRVEEGQPDIRGWKVVDRDDNDAGRIDDLLVSTEAEMAVFAIISYGGVMGMGGDKVLVPIDALDLDMEDERAIFRGSADQLKGAPKYTEDTREYNQYYDYWSGAAIAPGRREEERGMRPGRERVIPEVEEELKVGKREEQVGEVVVRKEVEMRPETVRERVRKSRVRVERRPVEGGREPRAGERVLREGETIEIPVTEERLVAEKRPVVTEEVVISPEVTEEEEEITRELRKEHVTVEKRGEAEVEEKEGRRTRR